MEVSKMGVNVSCPEEYFEVMSSEGVYPNKRNLKRFTEFLFEGVPLRGRSILDIGGGTGVLSFYAGSVGAEKVLCLEPEAAGSTHSVTTTFERIASRLRLPQVTMSPQTFQNFDPGNQTFDVILLHNSINHLDEEACMALLEQINARRRYQSIFKRLSELSSRGADVILADCSRNNVFGLLRITNPFAPSIEWNKHQSPRVWAQLLKEVGFANPRIRWSSFNSLGRPGRLLFGNEIASFFLQSHFCLTMTRE
jgi:SAM-dependent methyltransferase